MTLTFFTNLIHHHQIPIADEFYKMLGDDYRYVATMEMPEWLIKSGYDGTLDRPYIIRSYKDKSSLREALRLVEESDIVIYGEAPEEWVLNRKKANKITFHYNERWLRFQVLKNFGPKNLFRIFKNHLQFRNKRTYMLCASAYTKKDVSFFCCYPKKCFKWGYMTKVEFFDIEAPTPDVSISEITPLMWCSRFLILKHPELPVQLAERLKAKGYKFVLNMYGSGEMLEATKALAQQLDVMDVVNFCGNKPNEDILQDMRKHKLFLFTSDRNEGWGAVANESMSNGCVLVGSNEIGSVPFLVKDGINGCIFKSKSIDSLEEKVAMLLDNPDMLEAMRKESLRTMRKMWSPANAARQFLNLVDYIQNDKLTEYRQTEGPASWA
ncbi:MAG: glycosyltransferase [Bacteroides sp.]|nr:glycosyltransferase [Bacteroides sp.]MCM1447850.1 glycosyltransferase [Bacteroides sp.]